MFSVVSSPNWFIIGIMYLARRLAISVLLMYVTGVFYCYVYGENFLALRVPVPTNSAEVKRAALFAVLEYNKNNSTRATAFKTVRIISAERQMLEGVSYFLNVKLGLTTCLKNTTAVSLQSCPLQAHGTVRSLQMTNCMARKQPETRRTRIINGDEKMVTGSSQLNVSQTPDKLTELDKCLLKHESHPRGHLHDTPGHLL